VGAIAIHILTAVTSVAYDHDRQVALSGSATLDGTIRVWDTRNGTCLAILPDHDDHITYLRFNRDTFLSAATGSVKVWDARTHTLRLSMSSSIYITSLTVKGDRVVTAGGGVVRMWDPSTGITLWETDIGRRVGKLEWKDDCLVVLSMVEGPKSQAPRIDIYDFTTA
jgi:WD40 repeat protein